MTNINDKTPQTIIATIENHPKTGKLAKMYWKKIGPEITELVENIKKKPKLYQNDYGYYMQLIITLKESGLSLQLATYLLIRAGGNHIGIISAYKLITG